jgi:hypothetical protein
MARDMDAGDIANVRILTWILLEEPPWYDVMVVTLPAIVSQWLATEKAIHSSLLQQ